jgi:hypothetical protein
MIHASSYRGARSLALFAWFAGVYACGASTTSGTQSGNGNGNGASGGASATNDGAPVGITVGPHFPGSGSGFRALTTGCPPSTAGDCTGACERSGGAHDVTVIRPPATLCYAGTGDLTPDDPAAVIEQVVEKVNGQAYVHIRITFDPSFTDNTYGEGTSSGWANAGPKAPAMGPAMGPAKGPATSKAKHVFKDLLESDHTELLLTDGTGATTMSFKVDLISADTSRTCKNGTLSVNGGDGKIITGNAADVLAASTSIDRNLNGCGYCMNAACASSGDCTVDSPATDDAFTPNPSTPNWDYRAVYEVWFNLDAFGSAGFGQAYVTYTHASPSKGVGTLDVKPTPCPPDWDRPYCPPSVILEGGNCFGGGGSAGSGAGGGGSGCPTNQQTYVTSEGASLCTPIPYANYDDMKPCPAGYTLDLASEGQFCVPL